MFNFQKKGVAAGVAQANEQNAGMSTWLEAAHIGKIEVLRDEEPASRLSSVPHFFIRMTGQTLGKDCIDIMS